MRVNDRGADRSVRLPREEDEVGLHRPPSLTVPPRDLNRVFRRCRRISVPRDRVVPLQFRVENRFLPRAELLDREVALVVNEKVVPPRWERRPLVTLQSPCVLDARHRNNHVDFLRVLRLKPDRVVGRLALFVQVLDLRPVAANQPLDQLVRGRLDRFDDARNRTSAATFAFASKTSKSVLVVGFRESETLRVSVRDRRTERANRNPERVVDGLSSASSSRIVSVASMV